MSLSRSEKEKLAKDLTEKLSKTKSAVAFSFKALTVSDSSSLRRELRKTGGRIQVVKKRVFQRVAENMGIKEDLTEKADSVAVAWSDSDMIAPAKITFGFVKDHDGAKLLAGLLEGAALNGQEVESLALLPGKDELRAKLVATLAGPIRGFAGVLSGTLRGLPGVLSAIAEKQGAKS